MKLETKGRNKEFRLNLGTSQDTFQKFIPLVSFLLIMNCGASQHQVVNRMPLQKQPQKIEEPAQTKNDNEKKNEEKKERKEEYVTRNCVLEKSEQKLLVEKTERTESYEDDKKTGHLVFTVKGEIDLNGFLKENEKVLDYYCGKDDIVIILGNSDVHVFKLERQYGSGMLLAKPLIPFMSHTDVGEYRSPGVYVVDGKIENDEAKDWDKLTIATVTNDGVLQIFRVSLETYNYGKYDRSFCDVGLYMRKSEAHWPKKENIADVKFAIVNPEEFIIIPVGKKGANVNVTYYVVDEGERFTVHHLDWGALGIKNIFDSATPVYWAAEGGWMADVKCEMDDGEIKHIPLSVQPEAVKKAKKEKEKTQK